MESLIIDYLYYTFTYTSRVKYMQNDAHDIVERMILLGSQDGN